MVKKKFIVLEEAKEWALGNVNLKWLVEKTRVKVDHYTKYQTNEERLAQRPLDIPLDNFKELLCFWDNPKTKVIYLI